MEKEIGKGVMGKMTIFLPRIETGEEEAEAASLPAAALAGEPGCGYGRGEGIWERRAREVDSPSYPELQWRVEAALRAAAHGGQW